MSDPDPITSMARAFRNASDEDTMTAMNVLSTRSGLEACLWYVVPASWMSLAWSWLIQNDPPTDSWRQDLAIENKDLVAGVDIVMEDAPPEGPTRNAWLSDLHHKNKQQQTGDCRLKSDCVYEKDFFLLGANAWLLCRTKFGFDYEIPCATVLNPEDARQSLTVQVPLAGEKDIRIPFPTTGRFPVEAALRQRNEQRMSVSRNAMQHGNVSDDESDDLLPPLQSLNAPMASSNPQENGEDEILLLPPSTTASSPLLPEGPDTVDNGLIGTDIVRRRPYGTGLANLGNTCFMNSTLQCLAHTDPLRKYFLSGEYIEDLNRDNPLGTGGELAIQFASLLGEMWGTNSRATSGSMDYSSRYSSSTVYPRTFKQTLGRHAEQFVGYEQHDSQELAVYLLDALHEDTNRVTKKPYVEKPEKEGDESDDEAARRAWELHLKRDDSKVLSFFMGQTKSWVQCCKPECNRVSTTFDPFMYLSVPIPGTHEKRIDLTFVPLDPSNHPQALAITVPKSGTFKDVLNKLLLEVKSIGLIGPEDSVSVEDMCAADVFEKHFYKWYSEDDPVDQVRDSDVTFVYQLAPLADSSACDESLTDGKPPTEKDISHLEFREWGPEHKRLKLDDMSRYRMGHVDEWANQFTKYLRRGSALNFQIAFNPTTGDSAARVSWYNKTHSFLSRIYKILAKAEEQPYQNDTPTPDEEPLKLIDDQCNASPTYQEIQRRYDLAKLDFILEKMREEIVRLDDMSKETDSKGITAQIRLRKSGTVMSKDIVVPFALRIPPDMTVYKLRQYLAQRLGRCLKTSRSIGNSPSQEGLSSLLQAPNPAELPMTDNNFGLPDSLIIRQVPLKYERASPSGRSYSISNAQPLGSLGSASSFDNRASVIMASAKDPEEKQTVASLVGDHGSIVMEWPEPLFEQHFSIQEYERVKTHSEEHMAGTHSKTTSVVDCIAKYCQMEQLEESDMWYCNRCHEHVQAWKKVDIYHAPPILIIHLKRFHYSATTHRRDKIGIHIDFPLKGLDLTDHVSSWKEEEKPIYDCYAVSNHFGGLGGGHYTAYCLNDDGTWAYYDDSRITTDVDPKEVVSAAAYCLYYRRRDVPANEEYPISLQTPSLRTPIIIPDALISHPTAGVDDEDLEISSTNAAMVDDDEDMDLEDAENMSRATSPMGSVEDAMDHFDDNDSDYQPLLSQ